MSNILVPVWKFLIILSNPSGPIKHVFCEEHFAVSFLVQHHTLSFHQANKFALLVHNISYLSATRIMRLLSLQAFYFVHFTY
jgi:hypothetical protein